MTKNKDKRKKPGRPGGANSTDGGFRDATSLADAAMAMNLIGARTKRERREAREKERQERINNLTRLPR